MIMSLVFHGEPRGKARPRFVRRSGRTYNPKRTVEYEEKLRRAWQSIHYNQCFNSGALSVRIDAYYKIPQHATIADRERMMNGELVPLKKPDIDNVQKIILDALNGIAYRDDAQVATITATKHYSIDPRVEIVVEEIDSISDILKGVTV